MKTERQAYSMRMLSDQRTGILLLAIVYAVGIAGMVIPLHPDFILLTPYNLLFSLVVLLWYHRPRNRALPLFFAISFLTGFLAELAGVQTGIIFGAYQYGQVLGPKLWGTPLMIGINWVMVTYCTGAVAQLLFGGKRKGWAALLGAGLMVAYDLLLEPVAIHYGFWDWAGGRIPLQNFLAWFVIGWMLQLLFHYQLQPRPNFVAVALLFLQSLFFGILYLIA